MKESDWKIFKKIKEHALEKFCADFLADVSEIVGRNNQSAHEAGFLIGIVVRRQLCSY
jgi:hypothetical protein